MPKSLPRRHTLAVALLALSSTLGVPAFAQDGAASAFESRHGDRAAKKKDEAAKPARYPNATRKSPSEHASAKGVKKLNAMLEAFNGT
jgi:hypothetical protein